MVLLACIYFFLFASNLSPASMLPGPICPNLQVAGRLAPGNADYRHRLGRYFAFVAGDPQSAIENFCAAVALNRHDAHYWLDLAGAYQVTSDVAGQRAALDHALQAEPTAPDVAWESVNFFLVDGDIDRALREFHVVIENDLELVYPSFVASWRVRPMSDALLREAVPAAHRFPPRLSQFLDEQAADRRAIKTWDHLAQLHEKFPNRYLFEFVRYLIVAHRPDAAMSAWEQSADTLGLSAYQASDDNLVVNGDFSLDVLNGGFDWIYENRTGVRPVLDPSDFHQGHRSLSLTFEGPGINDAGISQLIPVRGATTYDFSVYYKSAEFEGAGGPEIVLRDAYSNAPLFASDPLTDSDFWKEVHSKVTTPNSTTCCGSPSSASPPGLRFAANSYSMISNFLQTRPPIIPPTILGGNPPSAPGIPKPTRIQFQFQFQGQTVSSALAPPHPEPAPVAKLAEPRLTNNALFAGTCGALLFGPLAFGAVEPWSVFVLETCSLLLFVLWAYRQWINRQIDVSDNPLYRPMAAFFALALLQQFFGTTAYRQVTYSHLLLYAAYGMLVFVATQTLRRSSQFEMMAKLFTAYGAVVAGFAVLEGLAPNGKLYWIWTVEHGGTIYGPYVNHNHYAGLMEMLTPFPLVLAVTRFTDGNRKIVVAGIAALMAASIFLSGSRGGMTAFAAQMVVLGVVVLRKRETGWKQPLILGAFLTLVIVFLVWMGGNEVTRRLLSIHSETRQEITGGTRLTIDRDCLHMLLRKPFLGWGLGTFPIVYPEFRSFYTTFFVNQAHNDYLQLLVETGLAGFADCHLVFGAGLPRGFPQVQKLDQERRERNRERSADPCGAPGLCGHLGSQLLRLQSANPGECGAILLSLRNRRRRATAGIATSPHPSPPP